jgi:hypothetical protein
MHCYNWCNNKMLYNVFITKKLDLHIPCKYFVFDLILVDIIVILQ